MAYGGKKLTFPYPSSNLISCEAFRQTALWIRFRSKGKGLPTLYVAQREVKVKVSPQHYMWHRGGVKVKVSPHYM
jgi:hypothetical protein